MEELTKTSLSDQPGEDVRAFIIQLRNDCKQIMQAGDAPQDLVLQLVKTMLSASVAPFQDQMFVLCCKLERNPTVISVEEFVVLVDQEFETLQEFWTPSGKTAIGAVTHCQLTSKVNAAIQKHVNHLKPKGSKSNQGSSSSSSSSSSNNEEICFDCGKKGCKIGHPGCPNAGERLHVPEKFKKAGKFKKPSASSASSSDSSSTSTKSKVSKEKRQNWPESDEMVLEDNTKLVLCCKCKNKKSGKPGRWF